MLDEQKDVFVATVTVRSELGRGSTFTMTLPLITENRPRPAAEPTRSGHA